MTPEPNEEAVVAAAEQIARMALGEVNVNEFQALLFQVGAMLAVWRAAMRQAGYSDYYIETTAWLLMTLFYGNHLTTQEVRFAPPQDNYRHEEARTIGTHGPTDRGPEEGGAPEAGEGSPVQ